MHNPIKSHAYIPLTIEQQDTSIQIDEQTCSSSCDMLLDQNVWICAVLKNISPAWRRGSTICKHAWCKCGVNSTMYSNHVLYILILVPCLLWNLEWRIGRRNGRKKEEIVLRLFHYSHEMTDDIIFGPSFVIQVVGVMKTHNCFVYTRHFLWARAYILRAQTRGDYISVMMALSYACKLHMHLACICLLLFGVEVCLLKAAPISQEIECLEKATSEFACKLLLPSKSCMHFCSAVDSDNNIVITVDCTSTPSLAQLTMSDISEVHYLNIFYSCSRNDSTVVSIDLSMIDHSRAMYVDVPKCTQKLCMCWAKLSLVLCRLQRRGGIQYEAPHT